METRVCPGCGRNEIHKKCPAHGTPYYMSGILFTPEKEKLYKENKFHRSLVRVEDYSFPILKIVIPGWNTEYIFNIDLNLIPDNIKKLLPLQAKKYFLIHLTLEKEKAEDMIFDWDSLENC